MGVAVLVVGAFGYGYARYRYGQIHKVDIGGRPGVASNGSMNILLVGNNCRSCLNGKQANAFGTAAQVGGGRSDVTMVLHLDLTHRRASLLSIPRDLFLPVPGTSTANRIDAALNRGPAALVQTVEQDLGIPIDHYVSVNFDSFQAVVNDLGGVDMFFPDPVKDDYSALAVSTPGCHHLDGFQALSVVRARHLNYFSGGTWRYDGYGDLSHIQRDHVFLQVLAKKLESKALSNPLTLNSVVGSMAPQLQVDSGFHLSSMATIAREFRGLDPSATPTFTLPVVVDPQNYWVGGYDFGSVVFPQYRADAETVGAFLGSPIALTLPSPGTTIAVVDGASQPSLAARTVSTLSGLGLHAFYAGAAPTGGKPPEATVYYSAGHMPEAQGIAAALSGTTAVAPLPSSQAGPSEKSSSNSLSDQPHGPAAALPVGGADLVLVTGTDTSVAVASSNSVGTSTSATSDAAPSTLAAPTPPKAPLPSFDPTACPS